MDLPPEYVAAFGKVFLDNLTNLTLSTPVNAAAHLNRKRVDPGEEMDNGIIVVDRILEPQTIAHFIESCGNGELPNGKRFSQSLPTPDEVVLLLQPYAAWAPVPYNALTYAGIHKIMMRIGSHEDSDRLMPIPQPMFALKSRLWEGNMPISDARWKSMELDEPKHHRMACEHLGGVISVFEYLNQPSVKTALRTTYNMIASHIREFDQALNIKRISDGQEPVSMAHAWLEYIEAHYQVMTTRAHTWVINHTMTILDRLDKATLSYQPASEHAIDPEQWDITNKAHDINNIIARADCAILISMEGYHGYKTPVLPPLYHEDLMQRRLAHNQRLKQLSRLKMMANILGNAGGPNAEPHGAGMSNPRSLYNRGIEQRAAANDARIEVRGQPKPLPKQAWFQRALHTKEARSEDGNPPLDSIGLVVYRLTHSHTDDQWTEFLNKLEADLAGWTEGYDGGAEVADILKLHWRDGKNLQIAEGDIQATIEHFKRTRDDPTFPTGYQNEVFLVVNDDSVNSYLSPQPRDAPRTFPGQNTGFVLAVDSEFDPNDIDPGRAAESPGYTGQLRILGSLIWTDLYALMLDQTQYPAELWPCAREHPDKIYIGPIVQWAREKWAGKPQSEEEMLVLQQMMRAQGFDARTAFRR